MIHQMYIKKIGAAGMCVNHKSHQLIYRKNFVELPGLNIIGRTINLKCADDNTGSGRN